MAEHSTTICSGSRLAASPGAMTAGPIQVNSGQGEPPLVLIVDDDCTTVALVSRWLDQAGFQTASLSSAEALLEALATSLPDLILLDLGLPGLHGLDALREIRGRHSTVPVVVLTGDRAVSTVVDAMREGAYDYLSKPCDRTKILTTSRNACESHRLSVKVAALERQARDDAFEGILGRSPQMRRLFGQMNKVAPSDISVLVHGESGTGKELVARAIHDASARASGPYVAVNCAAIPESLQDSELFGHEKGSFTGAHAKREGRFELANGGTLFLDEIAELSGSLQAKLLRVLQERRFERVGGTTSLSSDFRLIAASHRDLRAMVERGEFREDLYFRIAVFELDVPPLREREGDTRLLLERLLEQATPPGETTPRFDPLAMEILLEYRWPGNVRELSNVVQRAVVVAENGKIRAQDLPPSIRRESEPAANDAPVTDGRTGPALVQAPSAQAGGTLADLERVAIVRELELCNGNVTAVGKRLGIGRTTLYRRLKQYGLR